MILQRKSNNYFQLFCIFISCKVWKIAIWHIFPFTLLKFKQLKIEAINFENTNFLIGIFSSLARWIVIDAGEKIGCIFIKKKKKKIENILNCECTDTILTGSINKGCTDESLRIIIFR